MSKSCRPLHAWQVLSRTDDALAQIPGTDLVEFEKAWTLLGNAFNRTGWLQVMLQEVALAQSSIDFLRRAPPGEGIG